MRRAFPVVLIAMVFAVVLASRTTAQVGRLPSESPFHDIRMDRWLDLTTGKMFGGGGPLLVGPRDGTVFGAKITFRGNHTLGLSLGGWYAGTVRHVVDANDSVATRVKPDVDNHLIAGEFDIQLNLTGAKSWHKLAPYASFGLGLVHGQKSPASDTSGYAFGTHFFFAPSTGTRFMLSQSVALRLEARAMFWSLKYPVQYSLEPSKQPGTNGTSNAVNTTGKPSGYTVTPAILFGLSVHF